LQFIPRLLTLICRDKKMSASGLFSSRIGLAPHGLYNFTNYFLHSHRKIFRGFLSSEKFYENIIKIKNPRLALRIVKFNGVILHVRCLRVEISRQVLRRKRVRTASRAFQWQTQSRTSKEKFRVDTEERPYPIRR